MKPNDEYTWPYYPDNGPADPVPSGCGCYAIVLGTIALMVVYVVLKGIFKW